MSRRAIISFVTLALLVLVVFFSRHEIAHAWSLLEKLNLWVLVLLIPVQLIVYFAVGEMIFSYLRAKGDLKKANPFTLTRVALELNFVNHILPSGGISGISYMTWRLGKFDVPGARAAMAQAVRYVAGFTSYLVLLLISVVIITLDSGVNRFIILFSSVIACTIIFMILFGVYIINSQNRMRSFARGLSQVINQIVTKVTFGKKRHIVDTIVIEKFFFDFHEDYVQLKKDKRVLIKPFLWGLLFNAMDIMLFMIGFWALGYTANPAAIAIAYGIASFAGFILITPGGAGGYEALMISFMSSAGTPGEIAIAGILITRVILLMGTIITGYIFYQLTLLKYGKRSV
jgi:uncharacterized protein (TIRG00374 family)